MWSSSSSFLWDSTIRINWIKRNIILFLFFFLIYLFNRFCQPYSNIKFIDYILRCHFNDFIGGIVFCIYTNMILIFSKRKKPIFNLFILLSYMSIVALIWEFIFPIILSYSTSDPLDVLAYLLGTITYYLLTKKYYKKTNNIIVKK